MTPDFTTLSNLSGKMVIRFRTKGAMDFNNFNYVIVFNTCTPGGEPYPNAFATSFTNYSYAFAIGSTYSVAFPTLFQYILVPGTSNQLNPRPVPLNPGTTQLTLNDNGQNNEFQLTFARAQLSNPLGVTNPCPTTSGGTTTPAPSTLWYINFFTLDRNGTPLDSLGQGGPTDNSFVFTIDTTGSVQSPIFRPNGISLPSNPAAQLDGGEVDTFP